MRLSTNELMIVERLLQNRINADYNPEIEEILHKVRTEINKRTREFNRAENKGW